MHTGTNSPAYPGMALWSQARGPARNRPCSRACTQTGTETSTRTGTEAATKTALRKARCPLGFSEMQIAILSLLKGRPPLIAYWQIAEAITLAYGIQATEGAVRGALERLGARGFLVRSRAAAGRAQGNRYAFSADPCPHITPPRFTEPGMEASTEPGAPSDIKPAPSLLEEKRDRRNLSVFSGTRDTPTASHCLESLSEEDVAFHWPNLAKAGFGTCQIRQILARLFQVGIGAGNLAQGLTYAEWELEHGTMRDKNGEPVSHPLNWVFSSLARTGYYRRPQGYISPQEQAEIDATEEEERLKKAREARKKSAFEAWCAGLSPQEKMPLRVTPEEKDRLREHAVLMGVSLSAYVRTKVFGGRPLIPRTDECTIRELRRMGGLLKHHFSTMREANVSEDFLRLHENLLQAIRQKIDAIGIANHDREEDQV